ncbi:protein alp1-like [Plakobranchus ocellatus]|uniref:Protein alp1-like n=1 Tax=Plakobranchus ocellatus TaxID=259542 RepID=A0AAV3ZWE7_9GAST|nr:protein alp1-like [Plakobranchus ocellatus]
MWCKIASEFYTIYQFPLCLGAIDGKHIRIRKPNKSGSKYFNYKGYFSIVLLAVTDANGQFVLVDVGFCGGNSDGGVFNRSTFKKRLYNDLLAIPKKGRIPGTEIELPFVFVADDAFPLGEHITKPFAQRQLTDTKSILITDCLEQGTVSNVHLGDWLDAQMWRILHRQIDEQPINVTNIVKAITVLHNFVIMNEPHRLTVTITDEEQQQPVVHDAINSGRNGPTKDALQTREMLMNYFNSPNGSLPWQNSKCFINSND